MANWDVIRGLIISRSHLMECYQGTAEKRNSKLETDGCDVVHNIE